MHRRPDRDISQGQAVSGFDRRFCTIHELVPDANAFRGDNVPTITVGVT